MLSLRGVLLKWGKTLALWLSLSKVIACMEEGGWHSPLAWYHYPRALRSTTLELMVPWFSL